MRTSLLWLAAVLAITHDASAEGPAAMATPAVGAVPLTLTIQEGYEVIELSPMNFEKATGTVMSAAGRVGGAFIMSDKSLTAALWEPNGAGMMLRPSEPSQVVGFMPNGDAVGFVLRGLVPAYEGFEGNRSLGDAIPLGVGPQGTIVGVRELGAAVQALAFNGTGVLSVLYGVPGFPVAIPWSVNAHGVSAGYAATSSAEGAPARPVRWSAKGAPTVLPGKGPHNLGYAFFINASGVIVGAAGEVATSRAAKWENDQLVELGGFGGKSAAVSVNAAGAIVGYGQDADGYSRGFIHRGGKLIDLNTLIDRPTVTKAYATAKVGTSVDRPALLAADWVIQAANSINDKGEICGYGTKLGKERALLLKPVTRTITILTQDDVNKGIKASPPPKIEMTRRVPLKK
jgi:probable HAF family extracellular repeat protein